MNDDKKKLIISWIKWIQTALTGVSAVLAVVWDVIDIDLDDAKKDLALHIIQGIAGGLIVLWIILYYIIPFLKKKIKEIKYKNKFGVDISKLDKFYEDNKDKTLKTIVDEKEKTTKDKVVKEVIKEIKKEGIIDKSTITE